METRLAGIVGQEFGLTADLVADLVARLKSGGVHLPAGTTPANFLERLQIALHALAGQAGALSFGQKPDREPDRDEDEVLARISTPGRKKKGKGAATDTAAAY